MHTDEPDIDEALVARLIAAQFPHWAGLPVTRTPTWGTDNAMYRLGDDLVARLPRRPGGDEGLAKEHRWLRHLAPHLPLTIPEPLALGTPTEEYPYSWSVFTWLPGQTATLAGLTDPADDALQLAGFLTTLQSLDTTGAPVAGKPNFGRGGPLARRDTAFRAALADLDRIGGEIDTAAATTAWEKALAAPEHTGPPVWVHGDLAGGNMLIRDGRLSAVIDFGALATGDPAVDLLAAWTFFDSPSRRVFRDSLGVDDATWERGRGWGLSTAVIALPYYLHTYPGIVEQSRYQIREVLSES